eukprot:383543-Prorocentrum_minimum.AAC.1
MQLATSRFRVKESRDRVEGGGLWYAQILVEVYQDPVTILGDTRPGSHKYRYFLGDPGLVDPIVMGS